MILSKIGAAAGLRLSFLPAMRYRFATFRGIFCSEKHILEKAVFAGGMKMENEPEKTTQKPDREEQWFTVAGDVDDFIFYQPEPQPPQVSRR